MAVRIAGPLGALGRVHSARCRARRGVVDASHAITGCLGIESTLQPCSTCVAGGTAPAPAPSSRKESKEEKVSTRVC